MADHLSRLSAFLDGELSDAKAREIEEALNNNPVLQAELDSLLAVDALVASEFELISQEPVPLALAAAINNAPENKPANTNEPKGKLASWMFATAAAIALIIGGTGGYVVGLSQPSPTSIASAGWLSDIADYHAVYAAQGRHLVEVAATEREHIQKWLTKSVGDDVSIPDLKAQGLEFQGGRLLVASGKPVAQLMYKDANGLVVAICQIQSSALHDGFSTKTIKSFDMVSWGAGQSNFVVIADEGRADIADIARAADEQA